MNTEHHVTRGGVRYTAERLPQNYAVEEAPAPVDALIGRLALRFQEIIERQEGELDWHRDRDRANVQTQHGQMERLAGAELKLDEFAERVGIVGEALDEFEDAAAWLNAGIERIVELAEDDREFDDADDEVRFLRGVLREIGATADAVRDRR